MCRMRGRSDGEVGGDGFGCRGGMSEDVRESVGSESQSMNEPNDKRTSIAKLDLPRGFQINTPDHHYPALPLPQNP